MIGVIGKPSPTFGREIEIVQPFVRRAGRCRSAQQKEWNRTFKSRYAQSMLDGFDFHVPNARGRRAVFFRVIHQCLDRYFDRATGSREPVRHIGGIGLRLHEDSFFEQRVGDCKCPDRDGPLQVKTLDVEVTFRRNRSADPTICSQVKALAAVLNSLVEFRYQERSTQRRVQRRHEQPVVRARQVTGDCPERVSADSIGHQPLPRLRGGKVTANFSAKIDHGRRGGEGFLDWKFHSEIMGHSTDLGQ